MAWTKTFFSSSIGRKFLMSISGLFLVLFVIEHMTGNLLLLLPDEGQIYNQYSHFLVTFPLLRIIEVILFAAIFVHIIDAIVLWIKNRKARPVRYAVSKANENSSWISRNMNSFGFILLVFLVIHLAGFFTKARITHEVPSVVINGTEMHDMYTLVKAKFEIWWYVLIYLIGFGALAFHLWHGFQSGFRTLGLRHPKYLPLVKVIGYLIAIGIPLGFTAVPVYFYLNSVL